MLKWIMVAAVCALVVPVAAIADGGTPSASAVASSICTQQRTAMGAATFVATYGTNGSKANAFGKCVSKNAASAQQDVSNAAKTCKGQQTDANFASSHDGKTFDQFYGTSTGNGKGGGNAFGKCVSAQVKESAHADASSAVSAAKSCKAAQKSDPAGFATKYGKAKNAFGKCVAAAAATK